MAPRPAIVAVMIVGDNRVGALALIAWWREMGVGDALSERPIDWLTRGDKAPGESMLARLDAERSVSGAARSGERSRPPASSPSPSRSRSDSPAIDAAATAPRRFPTAPPAAIGDAARSASGAASSLDALREALEGFEGCALKATAKSLCFYRGRPDGRLMIIGEAPGREEDIAGQPFVGRAGQLLDRMLAAIGLGEHDVHITNVVYWRPPGNRTPTPQEVEACRPFLRRQIDLVAPAVVLTLGGVAAQALAGIEGGITRERGRWRDIEVAGRPVPLMPSLHPAYLLRTPLAKRLVWQDLLAVGERLQAGRRPTAG